MIASQSTTIRPARSLGAGVRKSGVRRRGFQTYTTDMYVTVPYVKCKTKKCGEAIDIDKPFASLGNF